MKNKTSIRAVINIFLVCLVFFTLSFLINYMADFDAMSPSLQSFLNAASALPLIMLISLIDVILKTIEAEHKVLKIILVIILLIFGLTYTYLLDIFSIRALL